MKQGVMIWGTVDLVWHIIHIVLIIVIGLNPLLRWFYFHIAWYSIMIVMDILVLVGANGNVRIRLPLFVVLLTYVAVWTYLGCQFARNFRTVESET